MPKGIPKKPKTLSGRIYTKKAVSFDPERYARAKERAKMLGFQNSFSAYIQKLVDDDTADMD